MQGITFALHVQIVGFVCMCIQRAHIYDSLRKRFGWKQYSGVDDGAGARCSATAAVRGWLRCNLT